MRFGALADAAECLLDVRFTPESRHCALKPKCPLSANSGHSRNDARKQKDRLPAVSPKWGKSF